MLKNYRHGALDARTAAGCRVWLCVTVRTLIYTAVHLLSRLRAGWAIILAKQTLACEPSAVIQMYSRKDGSQPSGTETKLCIQGVDSCDPLAAFHCFSKMSWLSSLTLASHNKQVLSLPGNSSLPPLPPLCLLGWLAKKLRDCVQMCLERGQPLCPGRTCGLGVFTLALFQAVSHTACWRLSLLDDNAQPSSHKGGFLTSR